MKKIKTLIADDSKLMRTIILNNLTKMGVDKIHVAKDGREALNMLKINKDIDLLFLDIEMPHIDGLEIMTQLRRLGMCEETEVIFISSRLGDEKIKKRCNALGVRRFIPKPFNQEQFTNVVVPVIEAIKSGGEEASSDKELLSGEHLKELEEREGRALCKDGFINIEYDDFTLMVSTEVLLDSSSVYILKKGSGSDEQTEA